MKFRSDYKRLRCRNTAETSEIIAGSVLRVKSIPFLQEQAKKTINRVML